MNDQRRVRVIRKRRVFLAKGIATAIGVACAEVPAEHFLVTAEGYSLHMRNGVGPVPYDLGLADVTAWLELWTFKVDD